MYKMHKINKLIFSFYVGFWYIMSLYAAEWKPVSSIFLTTRTQLSQLSQPGCLPNITQLLLIKCYDKVKTLQL